jgi:hypothetical protein
MLKFFSLLGAVSLTALGLLSCGGGGSTESTYELPEGTTFTILLESPTKISQTVDDETYTYDIKNDQVLDSTGAIVEDNDVSSEMRAVAKNFMLSAIFTSGELFKGTLYLMSKDTYESVYSVDGNLKSTFNLTIKWGTVFDDAQGTVPQTIRMTNCTIAEKKVYGSVDSWYCNYEGYAIRGTSGTINPL